MARRTVALDAPASSAASVRFDSSKDPISSPTDLLTRLATLFRLGDLLEEAITRKDVDAVTKLARELRATAESCARLAGWLAVDGASNTIIDARRQVVQVLGRFSEDELRALAAGNIKRDALSGAKSLDGAVTIESS